MTVKMMHSHKEALTNVHVKLVLQDMVIQDTLRDYITFKKLILKPSMEPMMLGQFSLKNCGDQESDGALYISADGFSTTKYKVFPVACDKP